MSNSAQQLMSKNARLLIKPSRNNSAQPQTKGNAQLRTHNNVRRRTSKYAQRRTKLYAPEETLMEEVDPVDGSVVHGFSIKVEEEIRNMVDVGSNLGNNVSKSRRILVDLYQSSIVKEFQGNLVIMCQDKNAAQ